MSLSTSEDRRLATTTYLIWTASCGLGVLLLLAPRAALLQFLLGHAPFSYQPANTALLLQALWIALPVLGLVGLAWLNAPGSYRGRAVTFVQRLLEARWTMPAVITLAVVIRLAWVAYYPTRLYADSEWYYEKAIDIASGRGYIYDRQTAKPTAVWPVGYPVALAALYVFTGPSQLAAKLANVALGALVVLLTHSLARQMFNGSVAVLAALWLAVLPGLVVYSSLVCSDILFLALILAVVRLVLADEGAWRPTVWGGGLIAFGAGLLNGAMGLTRSAGLGLFPVLGWLHWQAACARPIAFRSFSRWAAALVIGTGVALLPWTLRNYLAFHRFIPVSTNGGTNFWMGNNPLANGGFVFPRDDAHNPLLRLLGDEIAVDEAGYRLGFEFIRQNPMRALELLPAKVFYLYYANDDGLEWNLRSMIGPGQPGAGGLAHTAVNVTYLLLVLLAAIGLAVLLVDRRGYQPVVWAGVAFFAGWTLLHLPFFGTNRFALPVLPFLAIYASYALLSLLDCDGLRATGAIAMTRVPR